MTPLDYKMITVFGTSLRLVMLVGFHCGIPPISSSGLKSAEFGLGGWSSFQMVFGSTFQELKKNMSTIDILTYWHIFTPLTPLQHLWCFYIWFDSKSAVVTYWLRVLIMCWLHCWVSNTWPEFELTRLDEVLVPVSSVQSWTATGHVATRFSIPQSPKVPKSQSRSRKCRKHLMISWHGIWRIESTSDSKAEIRYH